LFHFGKRSSGETTVFAKAECSLKGGCDNVNKRNKALMRRSYEEISKGNLAAVDELIATDFFEHSPFVPGQSLGNSSILICSMIPI
jgi:hypothetical protein